MVATEFFAKQRLAIYTCAEKHFGLCGPAGAADGATTPLDVTVVDDTDGPFFNVQVVDLDGDGQRDLLVTNNKADGTGAVFGFERMKSSKASGPTAGRLKEASFNFTKHVLAGPGYKPKGFGPGLGGPGPGTTGPRAPGLGPQGPGPGTRARAWHAQGPGLGPAQGPGRDQGPGPRPGTRAPGQGSGLHGTRALQCKIFKLLNWIVEDT